MMIKKLTLLSRTQKTNGISRCFAQIETIKRQSLNRNMINKQSNPSIKTQYLNEVIVIRPFAILFLVIFHTFCVYNHSWEPFPGFKDISLYQWVARFSYSFMLEMFVFISGYIFAYQIVDLKKNTSMRSFICKKFKRLILPSLVFGIIYYLLFYYDRGSLFCLGSFLSKILNGIAHLWFLPMLFVCSVIGYGLSRININDTSILLVLLLLSIVSWKVPFHIMQIHKVCYYVFFYWGGYYVYKRKELFQSLISIKTLILLIVFFLVSFLSTHYFRDSYFIDSFYLCSLSRFGQIVYASLGILATYNIVMKYTHSVNYKTSEILRTLSKYCFGIYIYHQFILDYFYYHTSIPLQVGSYVVPIIGLMVTLIVSFALSVLSSYTKIGKFILG